jgi:hypothetical protein
LAAHLTARIEAMENQLIFVTENFPRDLQEESSLKIIQFWHSNPGRDANLLAELPAYVAPHSPHAFGNWRAAAEALNAVEDRLEMFDRFATVEDEFEPLETMIDDTVSDIDRQIQHEAEIYTDDRSELARDLSRDLTQRTAIPNQRVLIHVDTEKSELLVSGQGISPLRASPLIPNPAPSDTTEIHTPLRCFLSKCIAEAPRMNATTAMPATVSALFIWSGDKISQPSMSLATSCSDILKRVGLWIPI